MCYFPLPFPFPLQAQDRYGDAVHVYQSALKSLCQAPSTAQYGSQQLPARRMSCVLDCLALACMKNKQLPDAIRHILRSSHIDPSSLSAWYSHSYMKEEFALSNLRKQPPVTRDIETAMGDLELAKRIFSFLHDKPCALSHLNTGELTGPMYDVKKALDHVGFCNVSALRWDNCLR